jgi:hypothetical protein
VTDYTKQRLFKIKNVHVIEFLILDPEVLGSIPGAARFSE